MKRDVQVGVILGVIILAIIGVFLSTRTTVKEPNIPIPEIEEDTQVGMLDIHDLPQESFDGPQESFRETTTVQNGKQKESATVDTVKVEEQQTKEQDNVIVGEWNKVQEEDSDVTTNDQAKATSTNENWMDVSLGGTGKTTTKFQIYKVQQKDDLSKIAKKYYGDASKWIIIFDANRSKIHDRNNLQIGTELVIPEAKRISQRSKVEITTPPLSQIVKVKDAKSEVKTHIVQQGDSLYKLAVKYYDNGAKWNKILDANKKTLKNKKLLRVGQELIIPEL